MPKTDPPPPPAVPAPVPVPCAVRVLATFEDRTFPRRPMLRRLFLCATLVASALFTGTAGADSARPDAPRLGGPLVAKLDWNTRALVAADIDGDGLTDLALLNNDTGRIEILLRVKPAATGGATAAAGNGSTAAGGVSPTRAARSDRWTPVLENAPFRRLSAPGDAAMIALAVGDLDGDGRADIAYTSERGGLTVLFAKPAAGGAAGGAVEFHEPVSDKRHTPSRARDTLRIVGRTLLLLTNEGIAVWDFSTLPPPAPAAKSKTGKPAAAGDAVAAPRLPEPVLLRGAGAMFLRLVTAQINTAAGGGKIFGALGGNLAGSVLAFRERGGPETTVRIPAPVVNLARPLAPGVFVALDPRRAAVSALRFERDDQPLAGADTASAQTYPLAGEIASEAQTLATDLDGDGHGDLVVADPAGARLLVWRGTAGGGFAEPGEHPSLAGITALALVAGGGDASATGASVAGGGAACKTHKGGTAGGAAPWRGLLALSEKEGVLGVAALDARGNFAFPKPLFAAGGPKVLKVASDERGEFAVALTTGGDKREFQRVTAGAAAGSCSLAPLGATYDGRHDPAALKVGDFDGDGRPDVVVFAERGAARFFRQTEKGLLAEVAADSAFRQSVFEGTAAADVSFARVAGKPALLLASQGFVRAIQITAGGEVSVLFQANARNAADRLRAPVLVEDAGTGAPVLLAFNESAGAIEWFGRDAAGVFRHERSIAVGNLAPLGVRVRSVAGETAPQLLYTARTRLAQIPLSRRGVRAALTRIYESDLAEFRPTFALPANFFQARTSAATPPAADSLVLIDPVSHVLEIIRRDTAGATGSAGADGRWTSVLHFLLFDENPHYRGRRSSEGQPREALTADLTGDGLDDLVLLMHDRVFLYPLLPASTVAGGAKK